MENKDKILNFRVTQKELAYLKKYAEIHGMSLTDYCRHLVFKQNESADERLFKTRTEINRNNLIIAILDDRIRELGKLVDKYETILKKHDIEELKELNQEYESLVDGIINENRIVGEQLKLKGRESDSKNKK